MVVAHVYPSAFAKRHKRSAPHVQDEVTGVDVHRLVPVDLHEAVV